MEGRESGEEVARRRVARRVGGLLGALLPPAARRRAFAEASILGDWPAIVGPELAARCTPIALRGGAGGRGGATLELAVRSGAALELQHAAPQLVERINGHLGWRAVARLVLRQRPLPETTEPAPARETASDPAIERELDADLADFDDTELRDALRGLGRTLLARRRRRR
ncbi:MAG: hypothetical protein KatS3mg117_3428 [Geminicoccaceae bacterium]|nr:MAG: hypothetical protein KatS3mg117_3428 [Geminicoccaceae bacterium]